MKSEIISTEVEKMVLVKESTPTHIALTLDEYEAGVLVRLLGEFGGVGKARNVVDQIYDALSILVPYDQPNPCKIMIINHTDRSKLESHEFSIQLLDTTP